MERAWFPGFTKWTVHLFSSSLQAMMFDLKAWERGGRAAFFGFSKRISIPYGACSPIREPSPISTIRSGPTRKHKSIFLTARIKLGYAASVLYERGLHERPCSRNIAGAGGSASIAGKIIRASAQISSWYARRSKARRHRHGFQQALEDEFSGRGRHDDHVAVVQWRVRRLSCSYRVDVVFQTGA